MTKLNSMFLLLAAAIAVPGCAADAPDDNDDGGGGGGSGGGNEKPPLTPEGRYAISSEFDLATNMPGTAGTAVGYFIRATDDPDDPTKFIVDELIKRLPDGSIKNYAQSAAPFITGYVNDKLLEVAPELVGRIVELGNDFGQVARHFGTIETLEVNAAGATTKLVQGVHFKIDNVDLDFMFKDVGIQEIKIENVMVTLDKSGKITLSDHKVGLKFGALTKLTLEQAIIPMIDPSAADLEGFLKNAIDCAAVGQWVYEAIELGSPSTYHSACNAGLKAIPNALYSQLNNLDTNALDLGLAGTARGIDKTGDGKMDDITTGVYTGNVTYAGTPAPLGMNKFFGARM